MPSYNQQVWSDSRRDIASPLYESKVRKVFGLGNFKMLAIMAIA
jgi:hypothetical protein